MSQQDTGPRTADRLASCRPCAGRRAHLDVAVRLGVRAAAARADHHARPEVDDDNANEITAQLLLLAAEDAEKDITLYINSPGGTVTAGMAIYDTMMLIEPDVATNAMGLAASMGQFLLTAGRPRQARRAAAPRILMHQPTAGVGGTAADIAIQAEMLPSPSAR